MSVVLFLWINNMRTNVPHIYAIGDIVGNPMLAHKAMPEGRVAAEVIAGLKHFFDPKTLLVLPILIQKLHGLAH